METLCNDQATMQLALLNNVISQATYTTWVSNFFGPLNLPSPPPKMYAAEFIWEQINYEPLNPDCNICIQLFEVSSNDNTDNNDISFNMSPDPNVSPNSINPVFYSVCLFYAFRAILDPVMPIASFSFSKASKTSKPSPTGSDIIFQINFQDTTIAPTCWDLSGTVPPPTTGKHATK